MPDIPFIIETKAKSVLLSSHPQPLKRKPNPKSSLISAVASHLRVVNSGAVFDVMGHLQTVTRPRRHLTTQARAEGTPLTPCALPSSLPEMNVPNRQCLLSRGEKKGV